jgi:glycosyltransferase involved in cell wall biosynthesis
MMRILHVYKDYPPIRGGIEHHLQTLATGQAKRGHQVDVVVAARGPRSISSLENGVRVHRCGRIATVRSTPLSPSLILTAAQRQADILHLHSPHPPNDLAWLMRRFRPPAIVTYHADIVRQPILAAILRPLTRMALRRAARIIVTSPAMTSGSREVVRNLDRTVVVPLGIPKPPEIAADDPELISITSRFPQPRVLFVGCLRHYKGLDHLLAAMSDLPATLLVAGDGPKAPALKARAVRTGVADKVHFLGEVGEDTLWRLYASADVFVLPSDSRGETFGVVQVEAMAMGVPVISTELGTGTSWVNRHGETGLVVPPADPAALAKALRHILDHPETGIQMGRAGRQRARSELLADTMVDRVLEIYCEVLDRRSSNTRRSVSPS